MEDKKNKTGVKNVKAWISGIKSEHSTMTKRFDNLIREIIPNIQCTTKWHKPSQPLGVPFYGILDKGWMFAMWSFKDKLGIGFIAGTLLDPEPPVAKMAGPWNRNSDFKARRIDMQNESEFNEKQLRLWIQQAQGLPGWGKIEK